MFVSQEERFYRAVTCLLLGIQYPRNGDLTNIYTNNRIVERMNFERANARKMNVYQPKEHVKRKTPAMINEEFEIFKRRSNLRVVTSYNSNGVFYSRIVPRELCRLCGNNSNRCKHRF